MPELLYPSPMIWRRISVHFQHQAHEVLLVLELVRGAKDQLLAHLHDLSDGFRVVGLGFLLMRAVSIGQSIW